MTKARYIVGEDELSIAELKEKHGVPPSKVIVEGEIVDDDHQPDEGQRVCFLIQEEGDNSNG